MFKVNCQLLKKILPGIKKNIYLKDFTTFKIGGKAKYFFAAQKKEDLIKAINIAKKIRVPFFLLGTGSNLLVSDNGYKGLVIKIENSKLKNERENSKFKIYSEAGVLLSRLVLKALELGASGIEWAVGIPGTVGGGIYGNAGAFGHSMKEIVREVEVFDIKEGKIKILKNKDCEFDYRKSIFKQKKNLIILSVKIQLKKSKKKQIKERMTHYLSYKKQTQPLNFHSAGCIFKNPKNFFAGKLIEECGLKGKKIRQIKISDIHANFIVNLGKGKAEDVKKLINLAKKKTKEKFGIVLKEEICYLGF